LEPQSKSAEPDSLPAPHEPVEKLPDQAVSQLNEGLKVCHKVMTEYKAVLLAMPSSTASLHMEEPEAAAQRD
jgi:hypothetical protein